jgi:hypothetical protein
MKKQSALEKVLNYIRSYEIGENIFRGGIIQFGRGQTADNYRNYLAKAGYLKTIKPGKYQYIKKIPINMNYGKLVNEAYPRSKWVKKYTIYGR